MAFVATSALPGWKLGRWTQISPTMWQEQKLDNPKLVYQFQVVEGPTVPGSATIRLKMQGQRTEVLMLESTIQVFCNAGYLGEYCGHWQGNSSPPAAPQRGREPTSPPAAPQRGREPTAGYTPASPAKPARQASQRSSYEQTMTPAVASSQKGIESSANSRGGYSSAQTLDRRPEQVQKLCAAAKNGDIEGVKRLLTDGVDPDGAARDGTTPLMSAAGGGHMLMIDALLAARADPTKGRGSETPLTIAFQKGNQDILKKLFGASFNALDGMLGSTSELGVDMSLSYPREEIPENAEDTLRSVTARLAAANRGSPKHQAFQD